MKTIWPKIALLLLCCGALAFEMWHFRSGSTSTRQSSAPASARSRPDFVLLPADQIELWSRYFAPGSHAESWEPTLGDMNDVEADLPQITTLNKADPNHSERIDNPTGYYRQYLAVLINGRRKLFLNAICPADHDASWRKHLIVVRDGGNCFWHADYDPATRTFSDLMVNGRG